MQASTRKMQDESETSYGPESKEILKKGRAC